MDLRDAPRGSSAVSALVALVAGLAIGLAVSASGSERLTHVVGWIEPIGTIWVNAIRMTVIPLVVASLIVAVSGTAPATVGRLGTRALVVFVALLSVIAVIVAVVAPLIFSRLIVDPAAAQSIRASAGAVQSPEVPTFSTWLVALVPPNPFKAAADGAILPLVVFALGFGLALGRLANGAQDTVVAFFRGVAGAMTLLVGWVLTLAPVGVFALALSLAAKLGSDVVGAVGFYLLVHSALLVGVLLLLYLTVALFSRVDIVRFAAAALPAQIVAVTTRSSMAALPAMHTAGEQTLHLPRTVTSFALPLAVSVFRLNQPVSWVVMALFASKLYGVELAPATIWTLAATSVLMSFSVPGIPSGALFVIAPFFVAIGIPAESIGILIALDLLPDVFKTLCNVTGHLTAVTLLAGRSPAADTPDS